MVRRWKNHSGLNDEFRSGRPPIYGEEIETKVIGFYCQTKPMIDSGRWTLRFAEKELANNPTPVGFSVSHSTIQRILKKHNLKPHQVKYFLQNTVILNLLIKNNLILLLKDENGYSQKTNG